MVGAGDFEAHSTRVAVHPDRDLPRGWASVRPD